MPHLPALIWTPRYISTGYLAQSHRHKDQLPFFMLVADLSPPFKKKTFPTIKKQLNGNCIVFF